MPKVSQAIISFLTARKATHNGPDLLERYLQYAGFMETQVNVSAGKGWPVDGKRSTYTDGLDEWFNIRIPKNANSEPEFKDYELRFPLDLHAEAIGATGWDWAARKSRWLGFDFDSITGHAVGVGIKDEELERVKEAACALPWVEVRRSTGGNGLHLYVYFDDAGVPTENHTVHAALGRAVLGLMSSETSFDFSSHIDACGGNMWIWARKMTRENQGLMQIKAAERPLLLTELPANWRDHVEVVTRKRSKIRINGVEQEGTQDPFEELASSRRRVPLDDKHKQIIDELRSSGYTTVWVPDYHMLQTHTCALKKLMSEKKAELKLIGFFETIAPGKDPGQQNCFAFPLDNGGWKVYLYGQGRQEAATWEQDGEGWTTCFFNKQPNLKVAARAMGGLEDAEKGGFVFDGAAGALKAAEALGRKLPIPERLRDREVTLKAHKDGRLVAKVDKKDGDVEMPGQGWQPKKGYWLQIFDTKTDNRSADLKIAEFDNVIRALKTPAGERAGWMMLDENGEWVRIPREEAKSILLTLGHSKPEADVILGMASKKNWSIVNLPFQPEYPGNRQWNQGAAQYKYKPADLPDDVAPHHPHWDKVMKHCGQDLDDALQNLEWARQANIKTGADYLRMWAACMLREPYEKLPYLFFYGEQNSGKSIYHESLALLMTKGVAAADRALTNANDFNGELANAVLAYIEEKNVAEAKGAYNKLKDWVTSFVLWVRKMRTDAYPQVNTLHFVQTANERDALTIRTGDTRITMFFVPQLDPGEEIAKTVLIDRLKEEAPHFMRTLMDLQLPPMIGRLRLPVVSTDNKQRAEDSTRPPLETFIDEHCFPVPGATILFTEFRTRFTEWLSMEGLDSKAAGINEMKSALPHRFPYGIKHSNQRFIGNLSWERVEVDPNAVLLVVQKGKLRPKGN
jgi:hypothetical protein